MHILTEIAKAAPIISVIYVVIAGIIKYLKNNPESKLKIVGQSTITSLATNIAVNSIAILVYIGVNLYFYNHKEKIVAIATIVIAFLVIILLLLFIYKDEYKKKYAFLIAMDYRRFNKDRERYTLFSKNMSENVANHFIDDDDDLRDVIKQELNDIEGQQDKMHKLNKVTTRYDVMSIISWFAFPLLALNIFILVFDVYDNKFSFAIFATMVTVLVIVINTFIVYYDLKLQHGIVDQTSTMIKKHNKMYRKKLNKQKDKSNKDKEENK